MYRKWDPDKECMNNMSSTKPKFQRVKRWGCVTGCCNGSRKIYGSCFCSRAGHFPSLMEVTLRKTRSQREGPELCNVWTVPSQVRLPYPLDYLALWWVMFITSSFERDTTYCIYRGLTHCRKYLHVCSV